MTDNVEVLMMRTESLGAHLRKLAMRADVGELRSGIMGFVNKDGHVCTSWWLEPTCGDSLLIISASEITKMEFMSLIKEEMDAKLK